MPLTTIGMICTSPRTTASEPGALDGYSVGFVAACLVQYSGSTFCRSNMIRVHVVPPDGAMTWPITPGPYTSFFVRSIHVFGGVLVSSVLYAIHQVGVIRGQSFGEICDPSR